MNLTPVPEPKTNHVKNITIEDSPNPNNLNVSIVYDTVGGDKTVNLTYKKC